MRALPSPARTARCLVLLLGVTAAPMARADCKPVLDAMQKAGSQQREAVYDVDDEKSAPAPDADVTIRIGNKRWQMVDGKPYDGAMDAGWAEVYKLYADFDRSGKMGCELLGAGTYRGTPVLRYRFNNPVLKESLPPEALKRYGVKDEQVRKFVMLIDKSSGLPAYSEAYTPAGTKVAQAFVFGDAVKEPAVPAAKGRK